ncbi:MAG: DUF3298 domain-containing protein [Oscillibacter sp.]|nr:DUF3298 domain-containing protein [Oscillibacter sp.]
MEQTIKRKNRPVWRGLLSATLTLSVILSGCGGGPDVSKSPDIEPAPEVVDTPEPAAPAVRPVLGLTLNTDYHYDEGLGMVVNSMETYLPGADAATREEYPELCAALDRFRETALANAREAYQDREAMLPPEDPGQAFGGEVRSLIRRADARVVSIVNYWWDYSGGAHMSYGYGAANFDTATGAEITLGDILTEEGKLTINSRIGQELNTVYASLSPGGMVADYLLDDYTFSLEPDGVTFWFNPYEIASYADGLLTVKLYFDRDADLLRDAYKGDYDAWFVEIGTEAPYRFAAADGNAFRTVEAWEIEEPDYPDWYSAFALEFDAPQGSERWADRPAAEDLDTDWAAPEGRNIVLDNTGFFDGNYYYAHLPEGDYVIVDLSMEDDSNGIIMYGADGASVGTMEMTRLGYFSYPEPPEDSSTVDDWSLYVFYNAVPTDPYNVPLYTRMDLFGTWSASGTYRLTPAGFRLMGDLLYQTGEYVLTLQQDLTVTRRAADNWTVSMEEDVTLPAGTEAEVAATDGNGTVFFRATNPPEELSTDLIFALKYDDGPEEWSRNVGGVPEDELFDGLLYAG